MLSSTWYMVRTYKVHQIRAFMRSGRLVYTIIRTIFPQEGSNNTFQIHTVGHAYVSFVYQNTKFETMESLSAS